jgi:hypothetical protein
MLRLSSHTVVYLQWELPFVAINYLIFNNKKWILQFNLNDWKEYILVANLFQFCLETSLV